MSTTTSSFDDDEDTSVFTSVIKAASSRSLTLDTLFGGYQGADGSVDGDGAVTPRYDASILNGWFEKSNALRQNVDAYATNIDGHGAAFEPEIDLEADDTDDRIRAIIQLEQQEDLNVVEVKDPTDAEVTARKKLIADEQRKELLVLTAFFEYCCDDISFVDLRRQTRQDREVTGNAFWEILRDRKGQVSRFKYLESHVMKLMPQDTVETTFSEVRRTATKKLETVQTSKKFRRFVQRIGDQKVFFKAYGDPRVVSSRSGKYYADIETLEKEEPGEEGDALGPATPATEVMHFKIHSPLTPYGVPRWIGNLLSVLGSRSAEEVNYDYFENKSVPPLALMISGGRLSKDSATGIRDYIKNEIRGKENYHKILIIEALGAKDNGFENSGQPKVTLQPLTEAQSSDALFQNYDERNLDKVGMAFRMPRLLRGDTRDFNRSTAHAAIDFSERQVFVPERATFDYFMNRSVLPSLGVKHWKLKSNGPTQRDPESLSKMVHDLQDVFGTNTLMELAQPVFGRNFARIDEPWADKPLKLVLAEMQQQAAAANTMPPGEENPVNEPSTEADDSDPENQDSEVEAQSSREIVSDNTTNQPRQGNGRFGSSASGKTPKKRQARVRGEK